MNQNRSSVPVLGWVAFSKKFSSQSEPLFSGSKSEQYKIKLYCFGHLEENVLAVTKNIDFDPLTYNGPYTEQNRK